MLRRVLVTAALAICALLLRNGFLTDGFSPCFLRLGVAAELRFETLLTERIALLRERHRSEQSARDKDL
jgi:hypothetical protein